MHTDAEALFTGTALLQQEARLLDAQRWTDWLALYRDDCDYWVPARRADETLTDDPQAELSHIYYGSRAGLEDRVLRITSGRSAASTPAPRTAHLLGNVALEGAATADRIALHATWVTHVFFVRSRSSHAFFGSAQTLLTRGDDGWRIARKKIVLQNDYVPTMLDIYCF